MEKFDYRKECKELYLPKNAPAVINVPEMRFIMVDGKGDPNGKEYAVAVQVLYALSYTIKMSKNRPEDFYDYVVFPLEGLWWTNGPLENYERKDWLWTAMIRKPDFVTQAVFDAALETAKKKKPGIDISKAELRNFTEGMCVQMMHIGPYSEEPANVQKMQEYIKTKNWKDVTGNIRKHHEIYLSDPRKTAPEKLKTVLRHPVEQI
jgi:hypothetical protein